MEKFIPTTRRTPIDFDPFQGPRIVATAPTTEPQREVWTASLIDPEASCSYNESVSLHLQGTLDTHRLQQAIDALVLRHEGLRTVFNASGTRSIILADLHVPLEITDLSALEQAARVERQQAVARSAMTTPFDLAHGPLWRVLLFRHDATTHVLRIVGHHIVCDGWSMSILIGDLSILYSALLTGTTAPLPEADPYSRYAQAINTFYRSAENRAVVDHWKELFKAPLPQLDLPTDRPRPREKTWRADRIDIELPTELVAGLRGVGMRYGSSFVTTLLSVYEVLLARITGQRDIVVGLPAAGQSDMGMHHLVGHCVSLLPLRSKLDDGLPFNQHLDQRRKGVLDAFDHQRFTFSTLLREMNVPRIPGRAPLVPVVFNLDVEMADRVRFEGITHSFKSDPRAFEQFEMAMNASSSGDRLVLEWSYNTDLFDASTIRGWMEQLQGIITAVIADPTKPIGDLIDPDLEKAPYPPASWAGKDVTIAGSRTVALDFDDAARRHPHNKAVVYGERQLTYAELHKLVEARAAHLIGLGLQPGGPVALFAAPGPELIIGLLAVVRAGGVFIPIDKDLPAERIQYLLEDAGAQFVLTQRPLAGMLPEGSPPTILLDEAPPTGSAPAFQGTCEDPVYIIYTSGSTGQPKGTVVPHRGVLRTVHDQRFMAFGPELVFLYHLSISFDACQIAIMGALLNGGTLVIPAQEQPTLPDLARTITMHGVNSMATAGGYFKLLIDEHPESLRGMRHLMTGGDAISVPHVRKAFALLGPGVIINAYGPTENSMLCTAHTVMEEPATDRPLPIGTAINGATLHVLNEAGRPVRIGERGELHTGGAGVAIGYWNRPDLTAERFIPDPSPDRPGARLYRTGDMVRWSTDGQLQFIGRADDQVKVRGYRVEPGEIENALNDLALIKDRAVLAHPDGTGEHRLALYVVPANVGSHGLEQAIRQHLGERLPAYMVPEDIMLLETIPYTANGKADRKRLPRPERAAHSNKEGPVAPRNPTEQLLHDIWSELLDRSGIGVHDNFFELGGHSLLGIQMFARFERRTGTNIAIKTLFRAPTIAQLAAEITGGPVHQEWTNLSAIQPDGDRLPFFCVHGDEGNIFIPKYIGQDQPFYGFFHQGEDGLPIQYRRVEDIARHFIREMKEARPHGPYLLGGYSFGGIVAFEMACQLAAAGEDVPVLTLFDTYAPAESVINSREDEKLHEPMKRFLMRRMVKYYRDKGQPLPGKFRHFHIIDTYGEATAAYRPGIFPGRISLIRTRQSPGAPDMGWHGLAREGVEIRHVAGDHFSMIKEPHVKELALALREVIDKVGVTV